MTRIGNHLLAMAALAGGLGAACASKTGMAPQCQTDPDCGDGQACVGGRCIARAMPSGSWALELEPRSDSTGALTEVPSLAWHGGPLALTASPKVNVTGTVTAAGTASSLTSAHVVLTVPSALPGRPDLQFEADLALSVDPTVPAPVPQFALVVPEGAIGRAATIQLLPQPPQDAFFSPAMFTAALASTLQLAYPADVVGVSGRFFDALRQPLESYVARAFRGGQLVSNVDLTNNAGSFALSIPKATVAADPNTEFSVEIRPMDSTAPSPRFTSAPFSLQNGNRDLGSLYQAPFTQPNVFRFTVRGGTADGPAVSGAVVRAKTVLAQDLTTGTTDFLRDASTLASGTADVSLLPGTTSEARSYAVAVIPPAGSPYGILCVSDLPVLAGGTAASPANLQPIVLPRRPSMTGVVQAADGSPVSGVALTATRTVAPAATECDDAAGSPPASATTSANGTFTLSLDPGTYQLDYAPAAGSPVPRLTETNVLIAGDVEHSAQMPPGGLVEGDAVGPDGAPLPSAAVRLYELLPAATLAGQARTDGKGHFRIVIPLSN